jgi:hypothetical protein
MGDGLGPAVRLLAGSAEPLAKEQQLDLLADDAEPEADLPLVDVSVRRAGGKGGRPKGRMNRSTEQWVGYVQSRYRSPLIGLAETWSRSVEDLAKELQLYRYGATGLPLLGKDGEPLLNLVEAFKLQQAAMATALPYLHSKMPQAVQVTAKTRGLLVIGDLGSDGASDDDALTLNIAEYQDLGEAEAEQSDGGEVG